MHKNTFSLLNNGKNKPKCSYRLSTYINTKPCECYAGITISKMCCKFNHTNRKQLDKPKL